MKSLVNSKNKTAIIISIVFHITVLFLLSLNIGDGENSSDVENNEINIKAEFIQSKPYYHKQEKKEDKPKTKPKESKLESEKFIKETEINNETKSKEKLNKENINTKDSKKVNQTKKVQIKNISTDYTEVNDSIFSLYQKANEKEITIKKEKEINPEELYIGKIQQKLYKNWNSKDLNIGEKCLVSITQNRVGEILSFNIFKCDSEKLELSVQNALIKTEKIPYQEDFTIFSPNINIEFIVD